MCGIAPRHGPFLSSYFHHEIFFSKAATDKEAKAAADKAVADKETADKEATVAADKVEKAAADKAAAAQTWKRKHGRARGDLLTSNLRSTKVNERESTSVSLNASKEVSQIIEPHKEASHKEAKAADDKAAKEDEDLTY